VILKKLSLGDLQDIEIQEWQRKITESSFCASDDDLVALESYAIRDNLGNIMCCVGIIDLWENRAMVWSLMDKNSNRHLLGITKILINLLKCSAQKRIEMYVDCDFKQAHRWAKMLGFNLEAEKMKSFYPTGQDVALYARLK